MEFPHDTVAVISNAYEERLKLIQRAECIIQECSIRMNILDGKGIKTSMVRIRVLCPTDPAHVAFLMENFDSYRRYSCKPEYKRRKIFWEQHVKWIHNRPPEFERLNESNVVFTSIISTFKQDVGVDDNRTIRHYKTLLDARNATQTELNHLRLRIKGLMEEIADLERLNSHSKRRVSDLENELKTLRGRLVCRH